MESSSASCHDDATRLIDALTKGFLLSTSERTRVEITRRRETMLHVVLNRLKINLILLLLFLLAIAGVVSENKLFRYAITNYISRASR